MNAHKPLWSLALAAVFAAGSVSSARAYVMTGSYAVGVGGGMAYAMGDPVVSNQGRSGPLGTVMVQYGMNERWSIAASYVTFEAGGGNYHPGIYNPAIIGNLFIDRKWTPVVEAGFGLGALHRGASWRPLGVKLGAGVEYFFNRHVSVKGMGYYLSVASWHAGDPSINALSAVGMVVYHWGLDPALIAANKPAEPPPPPVDSDGDGVLDPADLCPGTPPNTLVDANGCPQDADGDGVLDPQDECPGTPPNTPVDAKGCPATGPVDTDGDGVFDPDDQCPGTPPGTPVDEKGCPFPKKKVSIELRVLFDTAKWSVQSLFTSDLQKVADFMKKFPESQIEIEGHTDIVGSLQSNMVLSQNRAEAVRQILIKDYGIDAARLTTKGYGPTQPIADNKTPAGRQANRRVVATVTAEE
jgi:OOP family OmpA-OmpF porin